MVQSLLKTNSVVAFLIIAAECALLWIPSFWIERTPDPQATSGLMNTGLLELTIHFPILANALAFVLIILSGLVLQSAINRSDIRSSMTLEPIFWMAGINMLFLISDFPLPILFANLFLILAFRRLMTIDGPSGIFSIAFDSTVFISLAALFNVFYALMIILVWVSMANAKTLSWREISWSIIGLIFPLYIISSARFLLGIELHEVLPIGEVRVDTLVPMTVFLILSVVLTMVVFFYSLQKSLTGLGTESVNKRKLMLISTTMMVISLIITGLNSYVGYKGMTICILSFPMTLFILNLFEGEKRKLIPDILTGLWFISTLVGIITVVVKN